MDGFWVVEMKSPAHAPRLEPYVHITTDVKKEEFSRMGKKKKEKKFVGWEPNLRDLN
jgi:hypothetical protein